MAVDHTVSTHTNVVSPGSSDTNPLVFGSTVGRFVIRERLGAGGMGEVYRAEDTQLKRTVAIKRLTQSASDHAPAARLLKEAQRASALNHPGIAGVYDVFTMGDELLLVMEFVDGTTLRDRMKREISVADFCTMAVECTDALTAAHQKGILHGDLKPANIMLTGDGQVKVCDFGLARRLPSSEGAAETTTTQHGIAGTPGYLAPEVILEQPVDERADIFSLGVVFYQMLARRHPFTADGLMATLDRILHHTPEPLDRINPHVPGRLARTVQRMLEKDPHERTATAAEIGQAIAVIGTQYAKVQRRRRLVRRVKIWTAAAVVAILAPFVVPRLAQWAATASLAPLPPSINLVVLPFTTNGGAERASFADGLTASLTGHLSQLTLNRPLLVVTEADRRERSVTTPLDASQQFGANLAFQAALKYSGDGVDVSTSLLDIKTGQPLRSDTFTIGQVDSITVDTRVLQSATRLLNIALTGQERTRLRVGTTQPMAHDLYLRGRAYLLDEDNLESVDRAIDAFDAALESDPDYALAHAARGQAFWLKQKKAPSTVLVLSARASCNAALAIDKDLAEGIVCRATVLNGTGEYEQARVEFSRAVERDPTNDTSYAGLAEAYENQKQYPAAERTFRHAIDLRPKYWRGYYALGSHYYRLSRFKEALEQFQEVVTLAPESYRGHNNVGAALFSLNQFPEAITAFKKSMSIRPNINAASNLGTLHYYEGQFQLAADSFLEAIRLDRSRYEIWGNLAHTYEYMRNTPKAIEAFTEARRLALELLSVNQRDADLYVELADYHAALGEPERARQAFSDARLLAPQDAQTLFRIAVFYETRLLARDDALAWLKKAIESGQTWHEIEHAPELKSLRADKRFAELRKLQTSQ